jgi:hypothetical protein
LGLATYETAKPGYYYDPNYYYLPTGTPSVEYEYDEPNNQPPSGANPSTTPQPVPSGYGQPNSQTSDADKVSVPTKPDVKNPSAVIDDEKDFADVDQDDGEDDDDDNDDDDDDDGDDNDKENLNTKG